NPLLTVAIVLSELSQVTVLPPSGAPSESVKAAAKVVVALSITVSAPGLTVTCATAAGTVITAVANAPSGAVTLTVSTPAVLAVSRLFWSESTAVLLWVHVNVESVGGSLAGPYKSRWKRSVSPISGVAEVGLITIRTMGAVIVTCILPDTPSAVAVTVIFPGNPVRSRPDGRIVAL